MKVLVFLLGLAVALLASNAVVSGEWMAVHQGKQDVIIVDVSSPEAYAEGHIPGAIHSPLSRWRMPVGRHAEVFPVKVLENEMRRLGINDDSQVVVYAHNTDAKEMLSATYVIWAMAYAGFENTLLLEGGLPVFVGVTGILSRHPEADRTGTFTAREDASGLVTLETVDALIGSVPMIDSRPAKYYFGAEKQGVLDRAGHISRAHSFFWAYNLEPDQTFKSRKVLHAMFEDGLGLDKTAPVIVYCTGGLEASLNYFVLHRLLGFENAKLYDASMKEWANKMATPMTRYRWE